MIWGMLVHLSTNLWREEGNTDHAGKKVWEAPASPELRFDRALFDEYVEKMIASGINTIVLDLGDGMIYDSHPEIAVKGAYTKAEMRELIARLNARGIEVLPKLNFSSCHDYWMGEYARMLSTKIYYDVVRDLIDEVCELFHPRYFHIGMDEENYANQRYFDYAVIRQHDLWWHDLNYIVDCIEKNGARAWMFSDYARERADEYVAKSRKSVVQCSWNYFTELEGDLDEYHACRVLPFLKLEEAGFDQLPAGSNEYFADNLPALAVFCKKKIAPERLLGFIQTTWASVTPEWRDQLFSAADDVARAIAAYENA